MREEVSIVSDGKVEWMGPWAQVVLNSRANFTQASEKNFNVFYLGRTFLYLLIVYAHNVNGSLTRFFQV